MEGKVSIDPFLKAKDAVYRLMKVRLRSEKEVRDRLKRKGFESSVIDRTIRYFLDTSLLDDRNFTRSWIVSRLRRPFGKRRIQIELKEKGIAPQIFQEEWRQITEGYQELDTVQELARRRAAKYRGVPREKIQQRVYGYLLRRGFSTQAALKAIREL